MTMKYIHILMAIVILDSALIMAFSLFYKYIIPYNDIYSYIIYPNFIIGNVSWSLYGIALFLLAITAIKKENARTSITWLIIFHGLIFMFASYSLGSISIHFLEVAIGVISIQSEINEELYKTNKNSEGK